MAKEKKCITLPVELINELEVLKKEEKFRYFSWMAEYIFKEYLNFHCHEEGRSAPSPINGIVLDEHTFNRLSQCLSQCKTIAPENSKLKEEIGNLWDNLLQKRKHQL